MIAIRNVIGSFPFVENDCYKFYSSAKSSFYEKIESISDVSCVANWQDNYQPFSCVFYDKKAHEVVLVRDHLGLQPLYYCCHNESLIIGETLPDIIQQLPTTPSLNDNQVLQLFSEANVYSDETLYQGIFRVEPGHLVHINSQGKITKKAYWQLKPQGDYLYYKNDQDYVEHFSSLLDEAMQNAIAGHDKATIAAEFSAGIDSSAVYCAAFKQDNKPELFMHTATRGTEAAERYQKHYEREFLQYFDITNLHRIGAENFNPIKIFQEQSRLFAGAPPHVFYMFANNIHKAVAACGHKILLSGFGGDQGVSGHAPLRHLLPGLIKNQGYHAAWQVMQHELYDSKSFYQKARQAVELMRSSHPIAYEIVQTAMNSKERLKNWVMSQEKPLMMHPYWNKYFRTLREAEWAFLQGPFSHEIRMRIEYSAIVSKAMGFEYRYPLLYPKLLEFYLSVPPEQKRRHGSGRYLIKRYLAKQMPKNVFKPYQKRHGLDIMPATMNFFEENFVAGKYASEFSKLPYANLLTVSSPKRTKINHIFAYMMQYYLEQVEK